MRIVAHDRSSEHSTLATTSTQSNQPDVFAEALRRARTADAAVTRAARRTLAEMAPGAVQRPVLQLAPNVHFLPVAVWGDTEADVCPLCLRWTCICGQDSAAPAPSARTAVKVAA